MSIMELLSKAMKSKNDGDHIVYKFIVTDEQDEIVFTWYAVDANMGFNTFRYDRPMERNTRPQFQQFFDTKEQAIEYCIDQGRAEKMARGL